MDFLNLIISSDIRNHLKKIDYKLNALEAAYIVNRSEEISISEKHRLYKEIIEKLPDCECTTVITHKKIGSIHDLLKGKIEHENELINDFKLSSGNVYTYSINNCEGFEPVIYPTFKNAISAIYSDVDKNDYLKTENRYGEIRNINVTKHSTIKWHSIKARLNKSYEIIEIQHTIPTDEDFEYNDVFNNITINIPIPFVKGDIVIDKRNLLYGTTYEGSFVFKKANITSEEAGLSEKEDDIMDREDRTMFYCGYFLVKRVKVEEDSFGNYLDLEYYRDNLVGRDNILLALSLLIKNEIDYGTFLDFLSFNTNFYSAMDDLNCILTSPYFESEKLKSKCSKEELSKIIECRYKFATKQNIRSKHDF